MVKFLKFKFAAILTLALASFANAQNSDFNEAKNLLNALYNSTILLDKSLDYGNKKENSKYFSTELVNLLHSEDECQIKEQGICNIDWDFLCACQDFGDFSVKFEAKSGNSMQVIAKITNLGNKNEILFSFVKENGKLKISNVEADGWSLRKILSRPYP